MKTSTLCLAVALALPCAGAVLAADDSNKVTVVRDYTDIVAPSDQAAYEAGIKSFNQCLSQHGFKYSWHAWTHETGDTYAYSYVTDPLPWSAFDAMRTAGKACDSSLRNDINPHLKSETSAFFKALPELSHLAKGTTLNQPYLEVIYFKLKPGHEAHATFLDIAKKITAGAEKTKWPNNFAVGEVLDAGQGSADFVVLLPAKTWADLGKDPDTPLWTMMENAYGKADAQAMRKSLNDTIQEQSSHIDSYSAELTYKASSK